jgi:hypothetical protein
VIETSGENSNHCLEDYIMVRFSICALICAAFVSAGATIAGKYTLQHANDLQREGAGIPHPDTPQPEVPPISKQRKVSKLRGNPCDLENGVLVAKDPIMRQKCDEADIYYKIGQVVGVMVWASPLLAIFLIVRRRTEQARLERLMAEIELKKINDAGLCEASSDRDSPCSVPVAGCAEKPIMPKKTDPLVKPLVQLNYEI